MQPVRPSSTNLVLVFLLLPAVTVVSACAAGRSSGHPTSGPAPRDARAFYPLATGWKWAYNVVQDGNPILATYAVESNEGGRATLHAGDTALVYEVRSDGILRTDGSARGDYLLKTPIEVGARWKLAAGQAEVLSVGENVEVAAGRFNNCAVVKELRIEPDRVSTTTYAPGVGPIKIEYQAIELSPGEIGQLHAELLGYTRPGEDPLAGGRTR